MDHSGKLPSLTKHRKGNWIEEQQFAQGEEFTYEACSPEEYLDDDEDYDPTPYDFNNKWARMASVIKTLSKFKSRFIEGNQKLQSFVQTIQIIQNNLPSKEDGVVAKGLKMLAMASTLVQLIPDDQETATAKAAKLYDLTECYNPGFMDLFRDFGLMKHFTRIHTKEVEQAKEKEKNTEKSEIEKLTDRWGSLILLEHPKLGIIGVRETLSDVSSTFMVSKNFNFEGIWDLIWDEVKGCIDIQTEKNTTYKSLTFSKYQLDVGRQFGSSAKMIDTFLAKNRKFTELGYERSYLFLGPPGSGKTTMSQRFASSFTNKIMQIGADALFKINDDQIISLIEDSKADVVLLDEVDKMLSCLNSSQQGVLLARIEKFRRCRKGLITIFTVNSIKAFPDAMLRPGRIDDIIEFNYPEEEDRFEILKGYAKSEDVTVGEETLRKLAKISAGLTGAWLKEIIIQLKVDDESYIVELIKKMLKYSGRLKEEDDDDSIPSGIKVKGRSVGATSSDFS